jgi:hypothetical protein
MSLLVLILGLLAWAGLVFESGDREKWPPKPVLRFRVPK